MNFEKIELIGFKSFADKMEIIFDNGVTAIVGPNGCGKSNISDAIRWVLGEQSAKTLRGSSMTDVIFNGTQNRKSLSYCEVSLYFDNSNHLFKSCDYQEVIMTRKLFRSGESEYYINKKPARMRDIIDLLHECGVSKNGYTVIGQGKVSELLSSKPEDRRAIFEEAVGIAKSKSSKLENERKLDRVRDNMLRVNDVMQEISKQLEPAQRAADKTRKFLDLSEQLKYHEINNFLYKRENAQSVKEKIQYRINAAIEESAVNENEYKKAEDDYNRHMRERDESDTILTQLHEEILEKSLSQEKLQSSTKLYHEKISYLKSENEKLTVDKAEKEEKADLLKKAIVAKKEYLDSSVDEKTRLVQKNADIDRKLDVLFDKIAKGETLSKTQQSEILLAVETLAGINKNIGSLDTEKTVASSRLKEVSERVQRFTDEVTSLAKERLQTQTELDANVKIRDDSVANIETLEKSISAANERISVLTNDIYKLNIDINNLSARQRIYANMKETFEGYPAAIRRLMTDAKTNNTLRSHIKNTVAQVIKTDKKYEVAIETAIGNAIQHIITETPEDAQYVIEYLKRTEAGRVTLLPITSVKPRLDSSDLISAKKMRGVIGSAVDLVKFDPYYKRVIEYLLGNTLIVDKSENALAISKTYRFGFKIVTLDGDVFNPTGTIAGGSRKTNNASFISTERMIEQIAAEVSEKKVTLEKLLNEKVALTNTSNQEVEKLNELNKKLNEAKQNISALTVKLKSLEDLISDKQGELSSDSATFEFLKGRISEIDKQYTDATEGNKILTERKQSATDETVKLQKEYDALRVERDMLAKENAENGSRISYLEAEVNATISEIDRMKEDLFEAEKISEDDSTNIEQNNAAIATFYKEIEKLTLSAEETSGIKELRERLSDVEQRKQKLNDAITQDDFKRKFHSSELTKLAEKRHDEEINMAKVDSELEYISKRVEDEYGLTYETAKDLRDENYDIVSSNQEISRLHNRINALGNVNPAAIDECRELQERYDGYSVQMKDLESAETDIKTAIKTITEDMLSKFNTGFEEIRGHFKRIFKELFGGGTADLILDYTDTADPLDAGIEIVAEPPGKKLQKISLLSGGEMSLTAIAILFAILKLRPMPFCVLDEIEAALDDANVERFARYLKNFSAETQFVVITHKKVTMELSDALFGVTMQEKGVSKIVSVKLADIKDAIDVN